MKNQYFGDVRDYLKYSLLKAFSRELSIAVCWLLTPDDSGPDGCETRYLCDRDRWRGYDPGVFDFLHKQVIQRQIRCVCLLEQSGLLGANTRYFSECVPDVGPQRCEFFEKFMACADGADLVFFDPDTGIEPRVAKGSEYVHWHELDRAFRQGHSLLVYQHFGRESHEPFVKRLAKELGRLRNASKVFAFYDSAVVFFLVAQPEHLDRLERARRKIETKWESRVESLPPDCQASELPPA